MRKKNGFILVGIMLVFALLMIVVPVIVKWVQHDSKMSVKDQKSSLAFALAEAAVDRGFWKVKGSTATFNSVIAGGTITGYNMDATYRDIEGGTYRVSVSSGPLADQITVVGEGRDIHSRETRSIKAIFTNTTVPGAIVARGALNIDDSSVVHWGPVMAMSNVTVMGDALYTSYPRKLSRQAVLPTANFDPTGDTNPPNTDSLEWWSNFNVPELPIFDFETLRSSAAATGTLDCQTVDITTTTYTNVYDPCTGSGCTDPGANCSCSNSCTGTACTDTGSNCSCTNACLGSGCADSGANCSCTGAGAAKVCLGNGCADSGANCSCDNNYSCSGSGCADSDGGGANCGCTKTCSGSGCADTGANCSCTASVSTNTTTTTEFRCCSSPFLGGAVTCNYPDGGGRDGSCTNCTTNDLYRQTAFRDEDFTWYWDNNATWTGDNGVRGTIVVRGDFTISGGDYYCQDEPGGKCTVKVPQQAWREYQKYDTTSATSEYPGDMPNRISSNSATYTFGANDTNNTCSSALPNDGGLSLITRGELWRVRCNASGLGEDLGIYGFLYVGGDLTRSGSSDVYGAMWVEGNVGGADNTMVFYNSNLKLPTLNVVLQRDSWNEIKANTSAWP